MSNPFITKLSGPGDLLEEDKRILEGACTRARDFPAGKDIITEGDPTGPNLIILEGWACHYKLLPEGTRQITSFLMPGDCCEMYPTLLKKAEHSIATITPARVALVERSRMDALYASPGIVRAFRWTQIVEEDTLRAWIVSLGRRNSVERVAHLMCELYVRARNIGLIDGNRLELPLTQAVIGDALGLTAVHVNRVLKKLRLAGVLELKLGSLVVNDVGQLARVAGFDEEYLHRRILRVGVR